MGILMIVKGMFQLPDVVGEEERRRERVFAITCIVTMISLSPFLLYYGLFDRSYNIIPMAALLLVVILSFGINKRGSTDIAAALMIWSTFLGLLSLAIINDGIFDSSLGALPALLLVASLLLEKRHRLLFSAICLSSLLALGLMQINQASFVPIDATVSFASIFDIILINSATIALVVLVSTYLKESVEKANKEKMRLSESEARFRTLIEHAPDGFEVVDGNGRFVEVNPATSRQLGYTREEVLKRI
jgi:PAS domain-containing protein